MKPDTLLKACLFAAAAVSLVLSIVIYFAAGDDINGRRLIAKFWLTKNNRSINNDK